MAAGEMQESAPKEVIAYHAITQQEVFQKLNANAKGLTQVEANRRLEKYGANELVEKKKKSAFMQFLKQFQSPIVWILIGATIISVILGEDADAIVIVILLIINAILGFIQESRAEKSIEALKRMASLHTTVLRDGRETEIEATKLVPGDIILLETGNKVPADARLLENVNFETQEAALTGESLPVKKDLNLSAEKSVLGDRKNMVFSGTIVTKGRAKAIVVATGMNSELGKIAGLIQETEEPPTPLQVKLEQLGKWLGIMVLVICGIVFLAGWLRGEDTLLDMFINAVALAVAAIPEGLPAVVTIALALGVQRMIKRHALVRKLPSVETLGCTTVICTDKTGTLTKNEMTVKKLFVDAEVINVTGIGYETKGSFSANTKDRDFLLRIGTLNNDARVEYGAGKVMGDPTEACLIVAAAKAGFKKEELEKDQPRIGEIQFDSIRKRMTTIHSQDNKTMAYMKGAPDIILTMCKYILLHGEVEELTPEWRKKILATNEIFAENALRVLGFAYREVRQERSEQEVERSMIFVGLQGMIDPPREEVKDAIARCHHAGIRVVMVTGDYIGTAEAIAKELGIEGEAVQGDQIEKINLDSAVSTISIYARVNPEHKAMILEALQKQGEVVAMTGDGVNDAPALKKANIGIAMGITGTDVAREASQMILTDDNFASIVNAVEEGRTIYDNIRKFVEYLLSSNIGEVLTIFVAIMLNMPLPLVAIQLLWINLVTDGLPALALGLEPAEDGIMERRPRKVSETILNKKRGIYLFGTGIVMTVGILFLFHYAEFEKNLIYAQSVAFTAMVMFEMFNVLNYRSLNESLFKRGLFGNLYLWGAIASSVLLQCLVLYSPLNTFFKSVPIDLTEWLVILAVSASVIVYVEIVKWLFRRGEQKVMLTQGPRRNPPFSAAAAPLPPSEVLQ